MNEIIKQNGIKYGVISGLLGVLFTLFIYVVDYKLFVNIWLGVGLLVAFLVIGIMQLLELRKNLGGFMTFKEGFTGYFVGALVGILISTAFSVVLFNFIDIETRDLIHEELVNFQINNLKNWNAPAAQIKETIEEMKKTPQFSTMGLIYGILKSLIGTIIFGLILAAIFKKNKPVF